MDYKKYYYSEVLLDFPPSGGICKVRTKRNMRPTECAIKWGYSDFYYIDEAYNDSYSISNLYSELNNLCDLEKSKRNYNILIEDSSPYKGTIAALEALNRLKKEIYNSFNTATVVKNKKSTEKIYWLSEFSLINENSANVANYKHSYYNIVNIHLIAEGYSKPIPVIPHKDNITIIAEKGKPNKDIY